LITLASFGVGPLVVCLWRQYLARLDRAGGTILVAGHILHIWITIIITGYFVGKKLEVAPGFDVRHLWISLGATLLPILIMLLQKLSLDHSPTVRPAMNIAVTLGLFYSVVTTSHWSYVCNPGMMATCSEIL
jgi:hypothetical protein